MFKMKRIITLIIMLAVVLFSVSSADAAEVGQDLQDYYNSQLEQSGADNLYYSLPDNAKDTLQNIGINSSDWRQLNELSVGAILLQKC